METVQGWRIGISILVAFLVSVMNGPTAAEERPFALFSFADTSCGTWNASATRPERQMYLYWFRGFVSGYNFANKGPIPLEAMPNNETLVLYVDKYCREHPLQPFVHAAFDLVTDLRR
jgi:hypothetical protein